MAFRKEMWATTAIAAACLNAHALDFQPADGVKATLNGILTFGTQIRASDASPDAYSAVVSPSVPGAPVGKLAGQNGAPDLNFNKGQPISTVAKGVFDLDVKKDRMGLFVRASAWKDFSLGERDAAYGNYANGFARNVPLSDRNFDSSSKFSNAELRDYYLYGSTTLSDGKALDVRVGRQVLNWGGSQLVGGGVAAAINPADIASALRPGAQPFEGRLPLGMLSMKLAASAQWNLDAFLAYEHRANVYPGCGTYFDVASFLATGCNMISFAPASEQANLANNNYVKRSPDETPAGFKHGGVSYGFKSDALGADLKLYALQTTSVAPSYRMTVNSNAGGVAATNYGLIYPENVPVLGASFNKRLNADLLTYGEVAYRPNQPISFNASDLLTAFVSPGAAKPGTLLGIAKKIQNIPVGGTFDAYDRYGVVTGSVGVNKVFKGALAAQAVSVTGEVGFSHINSLPDPSTLRFGRGTAYGAASYIGTSGALTACSNAVVGKQCTTDGYTSSNAWGVRMVASATYPNAVAGATLVPSLFLSKDIKGYSYDGTFSEGRYLVRPAMRAEWNKAYFAEFQIYRYGGGNYNLLVDRSYYALVAGMRF